jgi:hypothetical protein
MPRGSDVRNLSTKLTFSGALTWFGLLLSYPGVACSPPQDFPEKPRIPISRQAKLAFDQADAVVDGVIVRRNGYDYRKKRLTPALLKVERVWKGPKQRYFVISVDGCNNDFWKSGEKVRLLLDTVPDIRGHWYAPPNLNLPSPSVTFLDSDVQDYTKSFAHEIDRLVGSRRSPTTAVIPDGW